MSDTEQTIKILAIESSCDETAAAVVVNGRDMRSNVISFTDCSPYIYMEGLSVADLDCDAVRSRSYNALPPA